MLLNEGVDMTMDIETFNLILITRKIQKVTLKND